MSLITTDTASAGLTINELPGLLKQWMSIQDDIATLNAEVKQRRTKAKALREVILRIMDSHRVVQLNVSKGSIVHQTREVKESLKQDAMFKHYKEFFQGDEEKAKALLAYLEGQRAKVVKHDLRLVTGSGGSDGGSIP